MSKLTRVILVTDGDGVAQKAIEIASQNLGLRCISLSAGPPDLHSAEEIVTFIKQAKWDPVLVMFDDIGRWGKGEGEEKLSQVANHPDIQVIGALAVASNGDKYRGVDVDCSIDNTGHVVINHINKNGEVDVNGITNHIHGDTVGVLQDLNIPVIIGIGDLGKMHGLDKPGYGAPVTTKAIQEVLQRSGITIDSYRG